MTSSSSKLAAFWGAALALAITLAAGPVQAAAPQEQHSLSKDDQACLDCHAKPGLRKTLANGENLSLYIAPQEFANSKHNSDQAGCGGCHSDIDSKTHGQPGHETTLASKRSLSVQQTETCRDCHSKAMKKYEDSVHASLVKAGSAKAPLCASCHNPHATHSQKEANAPDNVLCQQCHKPVTEAFAKSVHGAEGEALECKDCHRTHDVKGASTGDHLRSQCLSCHKDAVATHASWLPNTAQHLEAVACAACHSPGATRRVDLRIYQVKGDSKPAEQAGVPQFVKLASTNGGLDGRALWSFLQDLSRGTGTDNRTFVRGRLEVQTGVEAHALAPKAKALKECASCHKQGAAAFQAVTISMVGPDGRPQRQGASQGILSSVESIGSVSGFYAIGGTRIKVLDWLLLLAVGAGIAIPAAHLGLRIVMSRRNKAPHDQQAH